MNTSIEIKEVVKAKYNKIAEERTSCCGDTSCASIKESYEEIEGHVEDADLDLGCGLPTKYAGIESGNVVVDLGSGAGNDAFIARSIVGEDGRVIGIDMAEVMHSKAVANAHKLGYTNVEFRLGDIEDIPLANNTADVVVSNCVFNLVPDKKRAFEETYRILKPGGHFSISDIVITGSIPEELRTQAELYVGCVAGAIKRDEYLDIVKESGYTNINVAKSRKIELTQELLDAFLSEEEKQIWQSGDTGIYSITVNATKPKVSCC